MTDEPLSLRRFDQGDFALLIAQVPDARFLLQWSGPEWVFPLDFRQLRETLAKTRGNKPSLRAYKAVRAEGRGTVGHVQLMDIDYQSGACVLGRVLIFEEHRGQGLGGALVRAALREAFSQLPVGEVTLKVFASNQAAIATYERAGFVRSWPDPSAHEIDGESWDIAAMGISRDRWLESLSFLDGQDRASPQWGQNGSEVNSSPHATQ